MCMFEIFLVSYDQVYCYCYEYFSMKYFYIIFGLEFLSDSLFAVSHLLQKSVLFVSKEAL